MVSYFIILASLWIGFFVFHSLLADEKVKMFAKKRFPKIYPHYRLLYNLFALLTFSGAIWYQFTISDRLIWEFPLFIQIVAYCLFLVGLLIILIALKNYDFGEFSGFKQAQNQIALQEEALITKGLNKIVRHPLYFGILLATLGNLLRFFSLSNLIFSLCIFIYLPIGIYLEEKKLARHFGQTYQDYKQKVKMLIPYIF